MYVDKKLSGVNAVQTLSRLNRTHRTAGGEQKAKTFVIDFVNEPEDIRTAFEPYFTNATLETETDPYIVVHLANNLAQAGIYTENQVRQVAELWVSRKGNNALSAAISPAQHDFRRRYAAAIEADDKVALNTLDLFRKDVSTYVRLYDFMSQIVDYGDPYMEMLSIFLRLLEKVIAESSWSAEVDLSDVVLVGVKHTKKIAIDISLTGDGELKGISAAGTGANREPKYVALQVVIDKMNGLFGAVVRRVSDPGVRAGTRAATARRPGPGPADPGELKEAVHGVAGLPGRCHRGHRRKPGCAQHHGRLLLHRRACDQRDHRGARRRVLRGREGALTDQRGGHNCAEAWQLPEIAVPPDRAPRLGPPARTVATTRTPTAPAPAAEGDAGTRAPGGTGELLTLAETAALLRVSRQRCTGGAAAATARRSSPCPAAPCESGAPTLRSGCAHDR
jgi:hypothetical protein